MMKIHIWINVLENKEEKEEPVFATVQVPAVLDRLAELPSEKGSRSFILLEDIINSNTSIWRR